MKSQARFCPPHSPLRLDVDRPQATEQWQWILYFTTFVVGGFQGYTVSGAYMA
jgi:hypothetical protein